MAKKQQPGCCGCSGTSTTCSPCSIPNKNLTVSWVNPLIGNGSTTLVYTPIGQWNSTCNRELLYSLTCPGGLIQFTVTYFISGTCPTGQTQRCVNPGTNPFTFLLASYTCSPFLLQYTVSNAGCPILYGSGYMSFAVNE